MAINSIEVFKTYTEPYKKYGEMIDLKIDHTYRVRELCGKIARGLGMPKAKVELLELCGLLHDIGRFEQWRLYKSYVDHKTVDHGDFGAEVLSNNNIINKFTTENQDMIIKIVKYHNKYRIPKTLKEQTRYYIDIVRDADKIDSLYILDTKELFYEAKKDIITKEVLNQFRKKEMITRKKMKTDIDFLALELAFIFDLKYKQSFEIVKENNYVNIIIDIYKNSTSNNELLNQLEEMRSILNNYVKEKLTC